MRQSGILLPITALPSPYGVGTLGRAAYHFVDFLSAAGQSLWQILPIGPTGFGDSPYQSFSAFAGNPYSIDLDILKDNGLLTEEEIGEDWGDSETQTDYGLLFNRRFAVLAKAAARLNKAAPGYLRFKDENRHWLDDYALFMAIKEAHGNAAFTEWPEALRRREAYALKTAEARFGPRAEFWRCLQYFFFRQWKALKTYANAQGVQIVGDIPIYVSPDSSDFWANPGLFQTGPGGLPSAVAGVPPDAFCKTGQLWGNPLYDWAAHKRSHYEWWLRRLSAANTLFNVTRIDHFRGFASYWAVPYGDKTAEKGRWRQGPGSDFIRAVHRALPEMKIIAEDLGFLTEEVEALLAYSGYPGMKVLQFAFSPSGDSQYLPHMLPRGTTVYTGTHDNDTTYAWAASAPAAQRAFARRYLGLGPKDDLGKGILRAALASVADTAIIPLQDWLGLPAAARFNTPSTLGGGNWRWRARAGQLSHTLATEIRALTKLYGRLSVAETAKEQRAEKLKRQAAQKAKAAKKTAAPQAAPLEAAPLAPVNSPSTPSTAEELRDE